MNLRDTIVARVREAWPAYALTHGRQDFYVPTVRDGGNTAALIDLAADTAVAAITRQLADEVVVAQRDAWRKQSDLWRELLTQIKAAAEFEGPLVHLPAVVAGLKSTANTADLALGIVMRERDERRAYAEVLHEDRARLKRELRAARELITKLAAT